MVFDPFLVVVDLMGKGTVDLNVGFTFSLALSGSHGERGSWRACLSLVGEKPLETESAFATNGVGEISFGSIDEKEDWELVLLSTSDRVCFEYENHSFPMYEVVFKDMGFRLPFSDFQWEMLCWTKQSPSHIHPNSYAFMMAFEFVCDYLKIHASKHVFFSFFTVQRGAD